LSEKAEQAEISSPFGELMGSWCHLLPPLLPAGMAICLEKVFLLFRAKIMTPLASFAPWRFKNYPNNEEAKGTKKRRAGIGFILALSLA
jgi:hypothetical protein